MWKYGNSKQQFKKHLKEQFVDSNLAWDAQDQIEWLRQGQDTAEDFFQKFKILLNQAWYLKDDAYVMRLLKTNVNKKIIDQIYDSRDGLPEEYEDWTKQIIQIDQLWRRRMASKRPRMQSRPQAPQTTLLRANPMNPPLPPITQRDATSVTYKGAGRLMNIDNVRRRGLCFSCGEQGYVSRFCPKKGWPQQIWSLWTKMNNEEKKKLAEELGFVKLPQ